MALHEVVLAGVDFHWAPDRGEFEVSLHEVVVVCVHKGAFSDVGYGHDSTPTVPAFIYGSLLHDGFPRVVIRGASTAIVQ